MLDSNTRIFLMNRKPGMVAREPLHEYGISSDRKLLSFGQNYGSR